MIAILGLLMISTPNVLLWRDGYGSGRDEMIRWLMTKPLDVQFKLSCMVKGGFGLIALWVMLKTLPGDFI